MAASKERVKQVFIFSTGRERKKEERKKGKKRGRYLLIT